MILKKWNSLSCWTGRYTFYPVISGAGSGTGKFLLGAALLDYSFFWNLAGMSCIC